MSRILVTGSKGFIGQHLTRELRARGHDVFGCDLLHSPDEYAWHTAIDLDTPSYARADVAEFREIERVIDLCGPFDLVYHAAAEFGRHNGRDGYERLWRSNVIGTRQILELQRDYGFRLVHFSSSEVYGDWRGLMTEEVMDRYPVRQLGDYAMSKWVNECQVHNAGEQYGTESVIIRLFNVYGPGEHYSPYRSALCRFVFCALAGLSLTVYAGHRRSWIYVDDLVRTLVTIHERFKPSEVYNLGNPESLTMAELATLVCQVTGADPQLIREVGQEPRTTRAKRVDVSKAVEELGHTITVPMEEGIRRTAAWMRTEYNL